MKFYYFDNNKRNSEYPKFKQGNKKYQQRRKCTDRALDMTSLGLLIRYQFLFHSSKAQ